MKIDFRASLTRAVLSHPYASFFYSLSNGLTVDGTLEFVDKSATTAEDALDIRIRLICADLVDCESYLQSIYPSLLSTAENA